MNKSLSTTFTLKLINKEFKDWLIYNQDLLDTEFKGYKWEEFNSNTDFTPVCSITNDIDISELLDINNIFSVALTHTEISKMVHALDSLHRLEWYHIRFKLEDYTKNNFVRVTIQLLD